MQKHLLIWVLTLFLLTSCSHIWFPYNKTVNSQDIQIEHLGWWVELPYIRITCDNHWEQALMDDLHNLTTMERAVILGLDWSCSWLTQIPKWIQEIINQQEFRTIIFEEGDMKLPHVFSTQEYQWIAKLNTKHIITQNIPNFPNSLEHAKILHNGIPRKFALNPDSWEDQKIFEQLYTKEERVKCESILNQYGYYSGWVFIMNDSFSSTNPFDMRYDCYKNLPDRQ